MSKKDIIAIDIDDVVANTTEALRLLVNERTGVKLTTEHYSVADDNYWGYYERIWLAHGLDDKIKYSDFAQEMEIDQSHVPLIVGVDTAINELAKRYHIILITARNKTWEKATRSWFKQHLHKNDIELYFCENHKDSKAKTKGELCRDLGVSLLIDDNPNHCQSALDHGVGAILFGEYGWQGVIPNGVMRCRDWSSVTLYLMGDKKYGFRDKVYELMLQVPEGRVTTYGDIAAMAGQATAARIVGGIAHYGPTELPWHRLVNRFGGLASAFPGGRQVQSQLLELEGIICNNFIVDNFPEKRWKVRL